MINLEIPKKFKPLANQANQVATEVFRPISGDCRWHFMRTG